MQVPKIVLTSLLSEVSYDFMRLESTSRTFRQCKAWNCKHKVEENKTIQFANISNFSLSSLINSFKCVLPRLLYPRALFLNVPHSLPTGEIIMKSWAIATWWWMMILLGWIASCAFSLFIEFREFFMCLWIITYFSIILCDRRKAGGYLLSSPFFFSYISYVVLNFCFLSDKITFLWKFSKEIQWKCEKIITFPGLIQLSNRLPQIRAAQI